MPIKFFKKTDQQTIKVEDLFKMNSNETININTLNTSINRGISISNSQSENVVNDNKNEDRDRFKNPKNLNHKKNLAHAQNIQRSNLSLALNKAMFEFVKNEEKKKFTGGSNFDVDYCIKSKSLSSSCRNAIESYNRIINEGLENKTPAIKIAEAIYDYMRENKPWVLTSRRQLQEKMKKTLKDFHGLYYWMKTLRNTETFIKKNGYNFSASEAIVGENISEYLKTMALHVLNPVSSSIRIKPSAAIALKKGMQKESKMSLDNSQDLNKISSLIDDTEQEILSIISPSASIEEPGSAASQKSSNMDHQSIRSLSNEQSEQSGSSYTNSSTDGNNDGSFSYESSLGFSF